MMVFLAYLSAMASGLSIDPTARWVDDEVLELGQQSQVTLPDGLAFEVLEEDGAPVGWVYIGATEFSFPFADRGEALAFEAALGVRGPTRDLSWSEAGDTVLALGIDPMLAAVLVDAPPVVQDGHGLVWTDPQGKEHVVVTSVTVSEARTRARRVLDRRVRRLTALGLDPLQAIGQDRLRQGTPRTLIEVNTDRKMLPLLEPAVTSTQDRWLTWVRDTTGSVDDTYGDVLGVHGIGIDEQPRWRAITGVHHRAPLDRATIGSGVGNIVITVEATGLSSRVQSDFVLTLSAPEPTSLFDVMVPRNDAAQITPLTMVPGAVEVVRATLADGRALEAVGVPWGLAAHTPGWQGMTLRLPEPIEAGEPTPVHLSLSQAWPASHTLDVQAWAYNILSQGKVDCRGDVHGPIVTPVDCAAMMARAKKSPAMIELGRVHTGQPVWPRVPGVSTPYPTELRVGTNRPEVFAAAIGGAAPQERTIDSGRWWIVQTTSEAVVSFGRVREVGMPALGGYPAVRMLTHSPFATGSPEFIRGVLHFFGDVLPAYPHDEIVVVQGPNRPMAYAGHMELPGELRWPQVTGGPGHLVLTGLTEFPLGVSAVPGLMSAVNRDHPHAVELGIVRALAEDWWRLDWSNRDQWLGRAVPALYRNLFMEEAYDDDVVQRWRDTGALQQSKRRARTRIPLSGSDDPWVGEEGAWLLFDALRNRIGEVAMLKGLHRFLEAGDPSLDALQAELTAAGGVDLEGFFDTWLVAGLRPSVTGSWEAEADEVRVELTADLPYGSYEVPIVLTDRRGPVLAWVDMNDGHGEITLPSKGTVVRVEVDPNEWLPLTGRASARFGAEAASSSQKRRGNRRVVYGF